MNTHRKEYIITITALDRVGIIHDVARAVSDMQGDLADMRQQVLRGYFSMILYVSFPSDVKTNEIKHHLSQLDSTGEALEVSIKDVDQCVSDTVTDASNYVLTAAGKDRIGFVATVTQFCKEHAINILDLTTTVSDGRYIMILFVDLSNCSSINALRQSLDQFAAATDLSMVLQHNDIFKATNEINCPTTN